VQTAPRSRRRKLILSGLALSAYPGVGAVPAAAQEARRGRRVVIGRLSEGNSSPSAEAAFRDGLRRRGYVDVLIEKRYAGGHMEQLPRMAAELVALNVDVIWTAGTYATQIAKQATRSIPIVMVSGDAQRGGLVQNLARPEGNLTGLTLIGTDLVAKRMELLKEIFPALRLVVAVVPSASSQLPIVREWLTQSESAARDLALAFRAYELAADEHGWDAQFRRIAAEPAAGVSVIESPYLLRQAGQLANLLQAYRLPAVYALDGHVDAGGLVSYGVSVQYILDRSAYFVARILDGARPADLPVEQPTQYELAVNMRTAKSLGITVPKATLVRANRVVH